MHVMEAGEGQPVLLLHGNPTWGFLYRKVVSALADAPLRLIMPDLVGLGLSDKPSDPAFHSLENHSACISGLIEILDLERLVLVVQDWGGPIGVHAMAHQLERLTGLVVMNTVLGPPRPGFRATTFHRFSQMPIVSSLAFRVLGFPQRMLWTAQGDRQSIRGPVARAYRWPLRGLSRNVAPLALARMVPDSMDHPSIAPLTTCQQAVEAFEGPTSIVWGNRDPVLGRVRRRIETLLPHAEVTNTEAGHFLQEEVPDEIAAAIRRVAGLDATIPPGE